jgi:rhamnopyranosyl-N-acetylglucosaminyl-diphospho-decaprenol beta-1,3/1,4-galactofuranosyltransferase
VGKGLELSEPRQVEAFAGDPSPAEPTDRVVALVLTYAAPASLARCLAAIDRQRVGPAEIVVTDNASPEPVDLTAAGGPDGIAVRVQRLATNTGPAGGHAAGLRAFLDSGAAWAWVMDDDILPEPDTLADLLEEARAHPPCVVQPMIRVYDTGEVANTQGWCGVLVHREVVERIGVPNEALFWWTEDTEYLQWRTGRHGVPVVRSERATVRVHRTREDATKPAWKYYYEARNQVYHRLHVQRPFTDPPHRHLRLRVRVWRSTRAVSKLAVRAVLRERDHRVRKLAMVGRGAFDGVRGRLGITVPVDRPDRPLATSSPSGPE